MPAFGLWSCSGEPLSSGYLVIRGVKVANQNYRQLVCLPFLGGLPVGVQSENAMAVAYNSHHGGTRNGVAQEAADLVLTRSSHSDPLHHAHSWLGTLVGNPELNLEKWALYLQNT